MVKTCSMLVNRLVPGMVLVEPLRHAQTGVVLVPSGTTITKYHLALLKRFMHIDARVKCTISDPLIPGIADESEQAAMAGEGIKPLPPTVDETAGEVYVKAFETIKRTFQNYQHIRHAEVKAISTIAANISAQIARNPAVLSQVAALKAIDDYTFSHSVNVAIYAAALAHFLGYSTDEVKGICLAGLLHDIGKLDIPRKLVDKPGPLTDSEFRIMQQHTRFGYRRLKEVKYIDENVVTAVSQHHEKVNGTGYYQNLKGKEIHPWAVILAIADVYDALTTDRAYRGALLPHEGAEILMASSSVDHLELNAVRVFTKKMPLYPPGARVTLNTGEIGQVISYHKDVPLRPVININDGNKNKIVDLAYNHTVMITRMVK